MERSGSRLGPPPPLTARGRLFRAVALVALAVLAVACGSGDTATPTTTSSPSSDEESYLAIVASSEGSSDGTAVTMTGVDSNFLLFSEAPARDVSSVPIAEMVEGWDSSFTTAPNAVLTWNEGSASAMVVVELGTPVWYSERLVLPYTVLTDEGSFGDVDPDADLRQEVPGSMQDLRLFIDDCDREDAENADCSVR